ncbi:MAG: DUF1028 domain-containing protein [Candidatus Bathyarchaeota archaeon]|nr:DUF1028 domain-containing protein [Candidatus Bathyarchaeota archaeon]
MKKQITGTFSILAISPDSKLMGVAVASGSTSVGDRVPHAKPRVGVIATQAYTNVAYGTKGLELMTKGLSPKEALEKLLREDSERELRQVAIMDFKRRKAAFTGVKAPKFHGEFVGEDYVVVGNLLVGKDVVSSMVEEFMGSSGDLAWRMAKTLKAGSESGGDRRGERSAALIAVDAEKVEAKIRVDVHENPIWELCRRLKSQ